MFSLFSTSDVDTRGLSRHLRRIEKKIDAVAQHLGVAFPTGLEAGVPPSVQALVDSGHKINAIAEYRRITGAGLAEAKDYVESL